MAVWKEIGSDRYDEMLGAVPPLCFTSRGFLVGEPFSGRECRVTGRLMNTFMAFMAIGRKFYECREALTVPEFRAMSRVDVPPL
jgi:hypothetical protein